VLDLNCRTGAWAIDFALAYPGVTVTGMDSDAHALELARQTASVGNVKQVRFYHADLHAPLNFVDETFHLVHYQSIVRPAFQPCAWPAFLRECKRVMKPGGVINLVGFSPGPNSSEACRRIKALVDLLMLRLGYSFSGEPGTHTPGVHFCRLLQEAGFMNCSYLIRPVNLGGWNNAAGRTSCQLLTAQIVQAKLLFVEQGLISSDDFDALLEQKGIDILEADFCASGALISAFATKE
jgi:hypothetical protein